MVLAKGSFGVGGERGSGGRKKEVVNESRWRSPHRNVIIHKQKGYFCKKNKKTCKNECCMVVFTCKQMSESMHCLNLCKHTHTRTLTYRWG